MPAIEEYVRHRETLFDEESGLAVDLELFVRDGSVCTVKTPLVLYVVGTNTPRIGTDSDETILTDLLSRDYVVAVLDYLGDERSVSPTLEWSIQRIKMRFNNHADFRERVLKGIACSSRTVYTLPAGYNLKRQLCFWSFDRHGVAGSFDFIISVWNSDFLGVWGNKGVITYPDGRKETVREYTERLPGGRVTEIYQCIKRDGKPLDMNLYMDILYPTSPKEKVPILMYAQSSQDTVGTWNTYGRPHLTGFLFGGYGVSLFDFAFIPMSRTDNWGYFDGDGAGSVGGVTGDNYTYSLGKPNNMRANTAAVRFLRHLVATEPETYCFDGDRIGVIGISKTGNTLRLGHPTPEILRESRFLEGHYGETRYEIGDTKGDGMGADGGDLIRGGEEQPWLTYPDGSPISSRVQFVNTSVGSAEYAITDGFVPIFSCGTMKKGGSYAAFWPKVMSRAYTHDVPARGYVCPDVGHSFGVGPDRDTGVDTMTALFEMADYYLKGGAPRLEYLTPTDGAEVKATVRPTLCFNAPIPESEIARVSVTSSRGETLTAVAVPSYGDTHFELFVRGLRAGESYTVTVPSDLRSVDGRCIKAGAEVCFRVKREDTLCLGGAVRLDLDRSASFFFEGEARAVRFFVGNDAASAVVAVDRTGKTVGRSPISGIGTYELVFDSAVSGGITLRTERQSGEYHVFSESFDTPEMPRSVQSPAPTTYSSKTVLTVTDELDRKGSGGSLKLADVLIVDRFAPYHRYYNGPQALLTIKYASDFTDADFGRRFTVSASVYDTAVRQLGFAVGKTSCRVNTEKPLIDCKAYLSSFTTTPGKWTDHRFRVDLTNPEGLEDFEKNTISLYGETWGSKNAECPIYLDEITVRETVTDVMLSDIVLIK